MLGPSNSIPHICCRLLLEQAVTPLQDARVQPDFYHLIRHSALQRTLEAFIINHRNYIGTVSRWYKEGTVTNRKQGLCRPRLALL